MFLFRVIGAVLLLSAFSVSGAQQNTTEYREAVLVKFSLVSDGAGCSSTATQNPGNQASANVQTYCSDSEIAHYQVQVGPQIFVLEPATSTKKKAGQAAVVIGTLGYGALFMHQKDVLKGQLPGAQVLLRSVGNNISVKVGKKESLYSIVQAE